MKYLIDNICINSDHIVRIYYIPETPNDLYPAERESWLGIETINNGTNDEWTMILRGKKADLFWEAYIADAYSVVNP